MKLEVDRERCDGCGACSKVCPQQILGLQQDKVAVLDEARCMGCFGCEDECPEHAIRLHRTPSSGAAPQFEQRPALRESYDVVVVGAGPAGLGAAIRCVRAGLAVCVCERLPNRRLSHHADGGVMMALPGQPAVEWDEREVRFCGLDIAIPNDEGYSVVDRLGIIGPGGLATGDAFPAGVRPGLIADKDRFVRALADEAERAGATLWYGAKVVGLRREGERFCGVEIDRHGPLAARVVVLAEGIQAKLSKKAGLPRPAAQAYAAVLSYDYPAAPGLPRGLFYMDGDLQLEEGMPPAMAGVGVSERVHVLLVLLFRSRFYRAPRPIDHYLELFLERDPRVRRLLGDALEGREPEMLNGCRAVMRLTNRDVVRDGLVAIGDAFVGGGELGNVPALANGVHAGEVIAEALCDGEPSREALARVQSFISDELVKVTEMNGRIKALPLHVTEEELRRFFEVMKDANYPTMLFGSSMQQGWMFTKLMLKHAWDFIKEPKLLKMMTGDVAPAKDTAKRA